MMDHDDLARWSEIEYPGFTKTEIDQFVGECIAMNLDPRMRPRVVIAKRTAEGKAYAHRLTQWMEETAEEILRKSGKRGTWGMEKAFVAGMGDEHNLRCAKFGLTTFGDIVVEIVLTIDSAMEFYDEVTRRVKEQADMLGKLTIGQRAALRNEVITEMGGPPPPRVVTGIGLLPIATEHETPRPGRRRITRMERAALLARRDAIDQAFPNLGSVQHSGDPNGQ